MEGRLVGSGGGGREGRGTFGDVAFAEEFYEGLPSCPEGAGGMHCVCSSVDKVKLVVWCRRQTGERKKFMAEMEGWGVTGESGASSIYVRV